MSMGLRVWNPGSGSVCSRPTTLLQFVHLYVDGGAVRGMFSLRRSVGGVGREMGALWNCISCEGNTIVYFSVLLPLFPPQPATSCTNEQESLMRRLTLPPCSSLSCCRKHSCSRQSELHCWAGGDCGKCLAACKEPSGYLKEKHQSHLAWRKSWFRWANQTDLRCLLAHVLHLTVLSFAFVSHSFSSDYQEQISFQFCFVFLFFI